MLRGLGWAALLACAGCSAMLDVGRIEGTDGGPPPAPCAVDADCGDDGVRCTVERCVLSQGACASRPTDSLCPAGFFCSPSAGCVATCGLQSEAGACADGADNDCDGLADCMDSDCQGAPACPACGGGGALCGGAICCGLDQACCVDPAGVRCYAVGCLACCGSGTCTASEAGLCGNFADDDCDLRTDCDDVDCNSSTGCVHGCPDFDLGSAGAAEAFASTAGATNDSAGSCDMSVIAGAPDVTFIWTAPVDGVYRVDTLGSSFPTVLYVLYDGCAGSERACGAANAGGPAQIRFDAAAGQVFVIVVDGSNGGGGNFRLHLGPCGSNEAGRCGGGLDDDCDGTIDCADSDCAGDLACCVGIVRAETGLCADGADNDCDGFADCFDPDCAGDPICPCADGQPRCGGVCCIASQDCCTSAGGGGFCYDSTCLACCMWVCLPSEAGLCTGGLDEDCDGLTDCDDPDCIATEPGCLPPCTPSEVGLCADGLDNDCDGLTNCADSDCGLDPACPYCAGAETACTDGVDNDCDGRIDCADPECPCACPAPGGVETACADGLDDDCDGFYDCVDFDCHAVPDCCAAAEGPCNDGVDNDCDALTDCADGDCASACMGTADAGVDAPDAGSWDVVDAVAVAD